MSQAPNEKWFLLDLFTFLVAKVAETLAREEVTVAKVLVWVLIHDSECEFPPKFAALGEVTRADHQETYYFFLLGFRAGAFFARTFFFATAFFAGPRRTDLGFADGSSEFHMTTFSAVAVAWEVGLEVLEWESLSLEFGEECVSPVVVARTVHRAGTYWLSIQWNFSCPSFCDD